MARRKVQCGTCLDSGKDNLLLFEDSDVKGWCYKCSAVRTTTGEQEDRKHHVKYNDLTTSVIAQYPIRALQHKPVSKEVCEYFGVRVAVSETDGKTIEKIYYPYRDQDKNITGYKVRVVQSKEFTVVGKIKGLFGQQDCKENAKLLLIVEGEDDALAAREFFQRKGKDWNVVSIPNGANTEGTIDNATRKELDWIVKHPSVIVCLDKDEPGQITAKALADLLVSQTEVRLMDPKKKDIGELLKQELEDEFWQALKNCKVYRPEAVVEGKDISADELRKPKIPGYELPYPKLQKMTWGLRKGEITLVTAGAGCGKSSFVRELTYDAVKRHKLKVANIALETTMEDNARYFVAMDNNVPAYKLMFNPDCISKKDYEDSVDRVIRPMSFFKHWGSLQVDKLMNKCYYYAKTLGVDFIVLDHVSMVVAGLETNNERKDLDLLFESMARLVTETGVGVVCVMHLKRAQGKNFNKGDEVELGDLRGSAGAEQMSFNVWALERDQQAASEERDIVRLRILKNRLLGFTGLADFASYNHETGRLLPLSKDLI